MNVFSRTPASVSKNLRSLISYARRPDQPSHQHEVRELRRIFGTLWNLMDEDGRARFHQTDAAIDFAFAAEGDRLSRLHLKSADAYFRLVVENRMNWALDASPPEWVAGDLEEMILAAWDCLSDSEKEESLTSLQVTSTVRSIERNGSVLANR